MASLLSTACDSSSSPITALSDPEDRTAIAPCPTTPYLSASARLPTAIQLQQDAAATAASSMHGGVLPASQDSLPLYTLLAQPWNAGLLQRPRPDATRRRRAKPPVARPPCRRSPRAVLVLPVPADSAREATRSTPPRPALLRARSDSSASATTPIPQSVKSPNSRARLPNSDCAHSLRRLAVAAVSVSCRAQRSPREFIHMGDRVRRIRI